MARIAARVFAFEGESKESYAAALKKILKLLLR